VKVASVDLFERYAVLSEWEKGLQQIEIINLDTGARRRINYPEPVYAASLRTNMEFATPSVRYNYQSLVTPSSVLFLGGSVLAVVLQAMTILRVSEFAQATVASPGERRWLENGVTFLNQLHLIFVHSWFLLTGLGLVFLGGASFGHSRWRTWAEAATLGGGLAVVSGEVLRAWFPELGGTVPMALASGDDRLVAGGMALGLLGTASLALCVSAPARKNDT
jgi:hypothetical protein